MILKIFDNLSQKIKNLDLRKDSIKLYVCGPTVYDFCHIGHGRLFVFFDCLRRFLQFNNKNVIFVQNITDIAEKIVEKSKILNTSIEETIKLYKDSFEKDMNLLNILKPDVQPLASEYIHVMIEKIKILLSKNIAYIADDGIYFDSSKVNYGKFEKRLTKNQDNHFALWKFDNKNNNMQLFDCEFGKGTPGWHIECTAMSMDILGERFDIHGGGSDLRYPHHENEIAQSEGLCGKIPADIWIHNEMINIKGSKMSKSLGNFWFIKDFITNSFYADVFRYFILCHNYQSIIEISEENFAQYKENMKNIRIFYLNNIKNIDLSILKDTDRKEILKPLYDNFNTSELMNNLNIYISNKEIEKVHFILNLFGFKMENLCNLNTEEINSLIIERNHAKLNKNFSKSDEIRNFLLNNYIIINDTKEGSYYYFC
jgi:cysteinyl-tRNA synthetase